MPSTAHGFPYPVLNDDNNPPADFQALAEAVDTEMFKTSTDAANLPGSGDFVGQQIRLVDTGEVAYWDGVEWLGYVKEFTPAWNNITFGGGAVASINRGLILVLGRLVRIEFDIRIGTGGTITSSPSMSLPYDGDFNTDTNLQKSIGQATLFDSSGNARRLATVLNLGPDSARMMFEQSNVATTVSSTQPWNPWAVNDSITGSFTYFRVNPSA